MTSISVMRRSREEKAETRSQRHRKRVREELQAARSVLARLAADGRLDRLVDDPRDRAILRKFLARKG